MWRMLQGTFSVRGQELLELLSTAKGIRGARLAEVLKEDMWPIDQKTSKSEVSITAFEVVFFARVELNSQELIWVCHVTSPGNHSPRETFATSNDKTIR
jgi:hypothetical protein